MEIYKQKQNLSRETPTTILILISLCPLENKYYLPFVQQKKKMLLKCVCFSYLRTLREVCRLCISFCASRRQSQENRKNNLSQKNSGFQNLSLAQIKCSKSLFSGHQDLGRCNCGQEGVIQIQILPNDHTNIGRTSVFVFQHKY